MEIKSSHGGLLTIKFAGSTLRSVRRPGPKIEWQGGGLLQRIAIPAEQDAHLE